jgi:hypothetical protein
MRVVPTIHETWRCKNQIVATLRMWRILQEHMWDYSNCSPAWPWEISTHYYTSPSSDLALDLHELASRFLWWSASPWAGVAKMYASAESRTARKRAGIIFHPRKCDSPADGVVPFPETRVSRSHGQCAMESVSASHDLYPTLLCNFWRTLRLSLRGRATFCVRLIAMLRKHDAKYSCGSEFAYSESA